MNKADIKKFEARLNEVETFSEELYNRKCVRVQRVLTPEDVILKAESCAFLDVQIRTSRADSGDNSDKFEVTISTDNQTMLVDGEEVEKVVFTIVGPVEFAEFINEIGAIRKVLKELNK